jgi:hypothetical protein
VLDPAHDRRVSQRHTAFRHHFHEVSVTELVSQIPAYAENDDVPIEMPAFEKIVDAQHPRSPLAPPTPIPATMPRSPGLHQSQQNILAMQVLWRKEHGDRQARTPTRRGFVGYPLRSIASAPRAVRRGPVFAHSGPHRGDPARGASRPSGKFLAASTDDRPRPRLCENSAKFCNRSSRAKFFAIFSILNALRPHKSERNRSA